MNDALHNPPSAIRHPSSSRPDDLPAHFRPDCDRLERAFPSGILRRVLHAMELTYECPECHATGRVRAVESVEVLKCGGCGHDRPLRRDGLEPDGSLASCLWCATDDLYIQKDFPHGLGLGIVVVGFLVSTIFWAMYMPKSALAVLLATAGLDMAMYYLVPDVTICYRCLSQFRGPRTNPAERFAPFDLAIGERYRQERIRIEEMRSSQPSPPR